MSSTAKALSTIDRIPAGLLIMVFHAYVEPRQGVDHYHTIDADVRHRRSVVLTHVCPKWRALALGRASLWTDIRLTGTAKLDLLYFTRSRPLPIDLTINLEAMGKRRGRVDCAALVGPGIISQPKKDRARIRSIRTTHYRDFDARSMISSLERFEVPALSELFIRTTSLDVSSTNLLQPQRLISTNFTILELHNGSQILDGKVVKRALEICHGLTSLVLGGLVLGDSQTSNTANTSRRRPLIRAPALKRLAVGTPMFLRPDVHGKCTAGWPCPFQDIVADKLEYLELAGDAVAETLPHLLPVLTRRLAKDGKNAAAPPPLTIVLNSSTAWSPFHGDDENDLLPRLPRNVHLHLFNDQSKHAYGAFLSCKWYKETQSTVLYVPKELMVRRGLLGLRTFHHLQPIGSFTPVILHPSAVRCLNVDEADMKARGWLIRGDEGKGPFLEPEQPGPEDMEDSFEPAPVPNTQHYSSGSHNRGYSDIDSDFDWQEYRRDMGWPDSYDTPSP